MSSRVGIAVLLFYLAFWLGLAMLGLTIAVKERARSRRAKHAFTSKKRLFTT